MKSTATQFYEDQAEQARSKVDSEPLKNVRDNLSRCADAWDVLALRSKRSDELRAKEALRKLSDAPHAQ
ncbi:hypothetical protein [Sphingomonas xanthus]|uniref:Uncharacterized protein n=1 Tax=Sphingomonas xanthus TaxID=2594473 RepID=A0A516IPK1_9SPHN|nr:hypothetical protein [Sphingomonas xanthus]QDP18852.1 hypothetical protein FMM02_02075 [Sphingomonas xanthus]